MDTCDWSEERYNTIKTNMSQYLEKNCGFKNVPFIPINAFESANVQGRVDPAVCSWYNGETLFQYLNTVNIPKRDPMAGVKIPILDV